MHLHPGNMVMSQTMFNENDFAANEIHETVSRSHERFIITLKRNNLISFKLG